MLETLTGGRSNFGGFDRDANGAIQAQSGSLLGDQSQFSLPTPSGSTSQPTSSPAAARPPAASGR